MSIKVEECYDMNVVIPLVEGLFREIVVGFDSFCTEEKQSFFEGLQKGQIKHKAFVAYNEVNKPIGCLTLASSLSFFSRGEYGIINELWVKPEYRSKGVGLELIKAAVDTSKTFGWKRIDVATPLGEEWSRTVEFYKSNDFERCGNKLRIWL